MVVLDEAAHTSKELFYSVIAPMLQVKETCFFALSTPEGSDNYFSQLLKIEDKGKSIFRICQCQMICDPCRSLEPYEQLFCNHIKETPHWLSQHKGHRLKLLYKTDPARAIKEYGGIAEDKFIPCFSKALIKEMFNLPPYQGQTAPRLIFITADPGSGPSQLALCSGYYDENLNFVVKSFYFKMVPSKILPKLLQNNYL